MSPSLSMPILELAALARRFACSNPHDAVEQRELLETLSAIRKGTQDRAAEELLDGALLLTSYMTRLGHVGGQHVLGIIARLLEMANETVRGFEAPSTPQVEPPRMESAAALPGKAMTPGEATDAALQVVGNMLLGERLVERGVISREQVDEALRLQAQNGLRFGEILIQLGAATKEQVKEALLYQSSARQVVEDFGWRDEHPRERTKPPQGPRKLQPLQKTPGSGEGLRLMSDLMLGEIMVRNGTITKEQLEEALRIQRAAGIRVGEALVRMKLVTKLQLECALQLQKKMRLGA